MREGRTYLPLWRQILRDFESSPGRGTYVRCPPQNIAKIKKALAKEKDMDTTWKKKRYYKLTSTEVKIGDKIVGLRFTLVLYRTRELTTATLLTSQ